MIKFIMTMEIPTNELQETKFENINGIYCSITKIPNQEASVINMYQAERNK